MTAHASQHGSATPAQPVPAPFAGPGLGTARMADGTTLRTLRWEPADDAWAIAEVVHGLGEHGGRYETVAEALTGAGIETWAYDHRGNGGSGGPRVYVEHWSILLDDLATRLATLRELGPDKPLILYGHSLGGLIATSYVLSGNERPQPDLLVLSAPAVDADVANWKKTLARVLNGPLPRMKLANGLAAGGLSRDSSVQEGIDADPLASSSSTVRFAVEAFAEQDRLRPILAGLAAMPMPTYVLHGSADPIVPPAASAVFERMGNVTRRVHEGLRHETHHEPEHEAVLAEVVAWIRANAPVAVPVAAPAPSPAAASAAV